MTIESFFIGTRMAGKRYGPQSKDMQVSEFITILSNHKKPDKYVLPDFSGLVSRFDAQIRKQFIQQKEDEHYRRYRQLSDRWSQAGSISDQHNRSKRFEKVMDESLDFLVYSSDVMPDINPNNASMLTLVAALAVAKAITSVTGEEALIKWPNDIVVNGKKVCGILTEMNAQFDYINHIVVGIGINVHNESFPEEISQMASSLMIEAGGKRFHRAQIIAETMSYFEQYYDTFLKTQDLSALVREYDELLVNRNKSVRVLDPKEPFDGKAMGITPKGELIVDTWESRKLVSSGEVSVRGIYGYV